LVKAIAWREENRELVASFRRNRRARERSADGRHTGSDIKTLFASQGGLCACGCGLSLSDTYEVDHKIPISRGGSNWPDNLQLLAPSCNRSKNDKTMEEWMACKSGIRAATLMRMQRNG
jgi:5-methylcytosine-specific restriction endonuclease McrA